MDRADIPNTFGLHQTRSIKANIGEAVSKGIDMSIDYNWSVNRDLWISTRANFTYATNKYVVFEEPDYSEIAPWRSRVGYSFNQEFGFVAERLFVDDAEVHNSPTQRFTGAYVDIPTMGGDLKYKDINRDGQISDLDRVPIGFPTVPEIVYGFGFSSGWKGFDLSCFFQGLARESFWLEQRFMAPFHWAMEDDINAIGVNQVLKPIADSHWTEENRNLYAMWPRLSYGATANNQQRSTWFMRNGSFLRLKSVEFGYSLPDNLISRLKMSSCRVYYSGTNLMVFSKFKMWDPEMAGKGLGYPIQRVHNIGVNVSF